MCGSPFSAISSARRSSWLRDERLVQLAQRSASAKLDVGRPRGRVEGAAGALDGAVGVADRCVGGGAEHLAGRRVDGLVGAVPLGGAEIAVDQQAFLVPHVTETSFSEFGESKSRSWRTRAQIAGSTTASIAEAPLSGTRGWRHTSTGNDTVTSAAEQPQQALAVVGQVVHPELLEVAGGRLEAGERGVVERLELVHRAGEALGVAGALGGQGPVGVRLEVGEVGGQECGQSGSPRLTTRPRCGPAWWTLLLLVLAHVARGRSCAGGAAGPPGR